MKKISFILMVLFAASNVLAQSDTMDLTPGSAQDSLKKSSNCFPVEPTASAYNVPARVNVCGDYDFFITGDFLWWEAIEENMEIAATINPGQVNNPGNYYGINFKYKPAFRVGVGYDFTYDDWTSDLTYTRYNAAFRASGDRGSASAMWNLWIAATSPFGDNVAVQNFGAKWSLDHNIFDLRLTRPFYNGQKLVVRPHYGLKGGWIDQKLINASLDNAGTYTYNSIFKSESWLIGPRFGLDSNWYLVDRFRIFGNAAFSLFYQKYHKISAETDSTEPDNTSEYSINHNQFFINSSTELQLGFAWGIYFNKNRYYFDIAAGYDVQLYLNQNVMSSNRSGEATEPGNLMFHGMDINVKFEF